MSWLREPDSEPLPGYRLIEPLGAGGFGEVWKCVAPGGIHKAMKFVFGNLNTIDSDSAKAEQEFKAIERVKAVRHPFVLSMDQIQSVAREVFAFGREKAGEDKMGEIVGQVPGLAQFV